MPVLSPTQTVSKLTALMRDFDRDGVTSRRLIDELLQVGSDAFREAAVQVLNGAGDTRAAQCLIGVLAENGLLLPVLCHPALGHDQVMVVARIAQRVDSTVEAAIAKGLADSVISNDPGVRTASRFLGPGGFQGFAGFGGTAETSRRSECRACEQATMASISFSSVPRLRNSPASV